MGALAIGAGMAASAGAGFLGSQAEGRNARKARDWSNKQTGYGTNRLWNSLYGAGGGGRAGLDAFSTGATGLPTASPGSLIGQQQGLADLYGQRAGAMRGQFDQGVNGLNELYGQSEGLATEYGRGGEALIDAETKDALRGADRASAARLAASGFGNSTAIGNQTSRNALLAGRQAAGQKLGLRGQALQMRLGVRGQQAGAQQQNIGRRADLYGNTLNNEMAYRQQPVQTQLNALNSNVMNPWLGQSTSQYYPGVSAAGTALGAVGQGLGLYGGYQLSTGGAAPGGGGYANLNDPYSMGGAGNSYQQWSPGMNRPH